MTNDVEAAGHDPLRKPWLLDFRSSNGFILATVCVAIFTDAFLYGVVVPVLPFSLRERSGIPEEDVQWWTSFIFAIFGGAILVGSPICGWIADHTSNRSITYFTGLFILAAATVLFGLAKAAWVLVISRLLQGLSAAIVYTVGLALLVDTVGRDSIGQWMGTALSSSSFGLIISPLLGGMVYAKAGYMAVFGMAMGLIVVDVLMRMFMIEKKTAAKYLPSDNAPTNGFYGTFTDAQTMENDGSGPSRDDQRNGDLGEDDGHYDLFSEQEDDPLIRKRPQPAQANGMPNNPSLEQEPSTKPKSRTGLPPVITLLASPRLLAAIYGIFVNVSVLGAFDGVLTHFVKLTFHWNSLDAGLIFLCLAIPALTGPLVGQLSDRFGPRWIAVAGFALTAPPLILLRLVEKDAVEQKVLLCGLLVLCGCTLILIVSPLAADLSVVVEEKEKENPGIFGPGGAYAQAFALFNCSMAAATVFGPVFAGLLLERFGWKVMSLALGIFATSGAIPSLLFTGGWLFDKSEV
ncbi:mfs general substrate transporter [Lasallia pustulata]|uniref:Mfs general substrate transporter n=1 Tax=Lasallia pustulata TaxID=136370 RepID=A0A1W5D759_9LECA|nr:mfs general substrate transporter [Lasallia pustulata]